MTNSTAQSNYRLTWAAAPVAILILVLPLEIQRGSRLTSVLAGFALLLLAQALWRRKGVAWWLTEVVLLYSVVAHLGKGLDYEEALLAALLAFYLWTQRSHFQALSDPPSIRQAVQAEKILRKVVSLGFRADSLNPDEYGG